jgi:hypothetical protein
VLFVTARDGRNQKVLWDRAQVKKKFKIFFFVIRIFFFLKKKKEKLIVKWLKDEEFGRLNSQIANMKDGNYCGTCVKL